MKIQKTLVNINFNPMRDEEILAEFHNVKKQVSYRLSLGFIQFGIGLLLFVYGLWNLIWEQYNPLANISIFGDILQVLIEIPFLFIFLGLVEILAGIAILYRKFGTLLFQSGSTFASTAESMLIATNFRLIYAVTGEAGLHSIAEDFYYDQMEQLECTYPSQQKLKGFIYIIGGIAFSLFPIIPLIEGITLWQNSLPGSLIIIGIGILITIFGLVTQTQKTPYLITIIMNSNQKTLRFRFDRQNNDVQGLLTFAQGFKFGVNRS